MSEENLNTPAPLPPQGEALARRLRHIGYALFGGLALLLAITLAHAAISGFYHNQVWDPFTGESVTDDADSSH